MLRATNMALALSLAACGFGSDVGHTGAYEIVTSTRVTDTAPYPLHSFLVVEHDMRVRQARIYCFIGDLRSADVGLEDLRRIALRFGNFAMAFDAPQLRVEVADDLDAGISDDDTDAGAGPITGHAESLSARVDDRPVTLVRLDDKALLRSGASRYLTALRTSEYQVNAYFGVIDATESLTSVSIESLGIDYAGTLASAEPKLVRTSELIGLGYTTRADYLVFELAQSQSRKADKSRVDALVRTLIQPGSAYALSPTLLADVASQGCWSPERPLEARIRQVVRSYQQRAASSGGDWAVSYERTEIVSVASEEWTSLTSEPRKLSYCDNFE